MTFTTVLTSPMELRAEIERLEAYAERADAYEKSAERTIGELHAEIERLKAKLARYDELRMGTLRGFTPWP